MCKREIRSKWKECTGDGKRSTGEQEVCILMTCLLTRRGGNGICPRSLCPAGSASRMSGNTLADKAQRRSRCTQNRAVGCGSGPPVGPWKTAGWRESSGPRPQARSTCWLALAEAGGGLHTSSILRAHRYTELYSKGVSGVPLGKLAVFPCRASQAAIHLRQF